MNVNFRITGTRAIAGASMMAALFSTIGCSTIVNHSQPSVSHDPNKEQHMNPWVWGNAVFAVFPPVAVAGVVVDAYGGHWYEDTGLPNQSSATNAQQASPARQVTPALPSATNVQQASPTPQITPAAATSVPTVTQLQPEQPAQPEDAIDALDRKTNAN